MNKKGLWISLAIVAVLVPVSILLCLGVFVWKDEPVEIVPVTVQNGGTVQPADQTAAKVETESDGTSKSDALYKFESKYGYTLQYNNKYVVNLSGTQYDFYIANRDETVKVVVTPMPKAESVTNIQTKEEWDAAMGTDMGECRLFKRTRINGMDTLVAQYYIGEQNGEDVTDVLMAMIAGDEYVYSYIYTASVDADETEKQQIGAILYTIMQ